MNAKQKEAPRNHWALRCWVSRVVLSLFWRQCSVLCVSHHKRCLDKHTQTHILLGTPKMNLQPACRFAAGSREWCGEYLNVFKFSRNPYKFGFKILHTVFFFIDYTKVFIYLCAHRKETNVKCILYARGFHKLLHSFFSIFFSLSFQINPQFSCNYTLSWLNVEAICQTLHKMRSGVCAANWITFRQLDTVTPGRTFMLAPPRYSPEKENHSRAAA